MSVFVRGAAARRATAFPDVRSILGNNALLPRGAKAAGAPRILSGTGLDNSRRRKARAAGAIVRNLAGAMGRARDRLISP
jgi:hypothetical protein